MQNGQGRSEQEHELAIEVVALRLIVRSVVAQMLVLSPAPISESLKAFEEAADKMSPDEIPIADLDPELHRRAAALARKRAGEFVRDIGKLVARRREQAAQSVPIPAAHR